MNYFKSFIFATMLLFSSIVSAYTLEKVPPSTYTLQAGTYNQYKTPGGAIRYSQINDTTICTTRTDLVAVNTTWTKQASLYKLYTSRTGTKYWYKADFTEDCKPVQPPTPPTNTVLLPPTGAITCGFENQKCVIPTNNIATVYYGVDSTWVKKDNLSGSVDCTNQVFTDPAQGYLKQCRYVVTATVPSEPVVTTPPPTTTPPPVVTNPEPVPSADGTIVYKLPNVKVGCPENQVNGLMTCPIPTGVTARLYYGAGTKYIIKDNQTGNAKCGISTMGDPQTGTYNRCFYVDNKMLEKSLDPKGQNLMPVVNASLTPKGSVGFSGPMIKPAAIPKLETFPYAGAFRISCEYSHGNFDDPIVFPGVKDATHHHTFFGNTAVDYRTTIGSLTTTGNSTCAGGILNRSGYWMPSLIDTATGAPQKPSVVVVYYKAADDNHGMYIKTPPAGLRMIAGNPRPLAIADVDNGFFCQDQTQVMNPANWGIMWKGNSIKQSCGGANQMLRMIVSFPSCWDGMNLDSPDHKSHMAFSCGTECLKADGKVGKTINGCPASHPVAIPSIAINADFYGLNASAKYRLSSDNYNKDLPGGYSLHADWMNGWDENTISEVVKNCHNNPRNCGGPNLGNGYTLYGVNQD